MTLNVISNYAANVAHRNLMKSDMEATGSLAKLSAGTRVLSAKDDAAALAVGSRLAIEVSALRQASVNASQASSMLQIADGAMAKVFDILSRMKSLAVQAASGHLSTADRNNLNTEFDQLKSEVDRIAENTTFSGTKLVNGSQVLQTQPTGLTTGDGVQSITVNNFDVAAGATDTSYSLGYDGSTQTFTLTDGTTNYVGSISADAIDGGTGTTNKAVTVRLSAAGSESTVNVNLASGFDTTTNGSVTSTGVTITGSTTTSFMFKVGPGTAADNDITISLASVTLAALGFTSTDQIDTVTNANNASNTIDNAVDMLNTARATVGALQNRLDFAAANISIATENTEAARSTLMDLDVASEFSNFTSKQILLQAGVAMLAQANQMPQNLLRLFQ